MALKATVSGRVMDIYEKKYTAKDGTEKSVIVADVYVGRQVFPVSKVPLSLYTVNEMATIPVRIYNNQYGISLMFDDEAMI